MDNCPVQLLAYADAVLNNDRTYRGTTCRRCGGTEKYTAQRACVPCARHSRLIRTLLATDEDAQREAQRRRTYIANNRDDVLRSKREYRARLTPEQREAEKEAQRKRNDLQRSDPESPYSKRMKRKAVRAKEAAREARALKRIQWHLDTPHREARQREAARLRKAKARQASRLRRQSMTPEQRAADNARWRAKYAEPGSTLRAYTKAKKKKRQALKRGAGIVAATAPQLAELLASQGLACAYCGKTGDLHLDHKQPVSRGGQHNMCNLQYLCAFHNMSKGAQTDEEYRTAHGIPEVTPWDDLIGYPPTDDFDLLI